MRILRFQGINFHVPKHLNTGIVEKYWNHERGYRIADILCAFEKLAFRFRSIIHDLDWSAPKSPIRGHIQLQL